MPYGSFVSNLILFPFFRYNFLNPLLIVNSTYLLYFAYLVVSKLFCGYSSALINQQAFYENILLGQVNNFCQQEFSNLKNQQVKHQEMLDYLSTQKDLNEKSRKLLKNKDVSDNEIFSNLLSEAKKYFNTGEKKEDAKNNVSPSFKFN